MPMLLARLRTASSSGSGKRRLTDLSFLRSSKRVGTISEKSYPLRSTVATKRSASASLLKSGNFFFMRQRLFLVHVAGANRPNEQEPPSSSHGEDHEDVATFGHN